MKLINFLDCSLLDHDEEECKLDTLKITTAYTFHHEDNGCTCVNTSTETEESLSCPPPETTKKEDCGKFENKDPHTYYHLWETTLCTVTNCEVYPLNVLPLIFFFHFIIH